MKKRFLPILLCGSMMLAAIAGCGNAGVRDIQEDTAGSGSADETAQTVTDYTYAREKYGLDEVVMTVDGLDVTWDEYFYWLGYSVTLIEQYYGAITDWNANCPFDETQTYKDYVMQSANDIVIQYHALEKNATEAGATISEEDQAYLDGLWEQDRESYAEGDEDAFQKYLKSIYLSEENYYYVNKVSKLYSNAFEILYGKDGAGCTDEEVAAYVEDGGYVRTKQIYYSTVGEDGSTALSDEEIAAKKAAAEAALAELKTCGTTDAMLAKFDELAKAQSEDPSKDNYPDGYTIANNGVNTEIYDAVKELADNTLVDSIVETSTGYYVVARIPIAYDAVVAYNSENTVYTLRYMAAVDLYEKVVQGWIADAEIEYTDLYNNLDIAAVFTKN